MRHVSFFVLSFLASNLSIHTSDKNVQDTSHLNLNNKFIMDPAFSSILAAAPRIITVSAQHHQLLAPQPVKCAFLTELDLSKGSLRVFPIGVFVKAMPALKKLNLAHNNITSVASENDETRIPVLGGPIWCWHSKSLQELDVSHNQLTVFDLTIINNTPNLIKANFSHNLIAEIKIPERQIGEGGCLNHRQLCTVQLQNTLLNRVHKELLEEHSARTTKEYETAIADNSIRARTTTIATTACILGLTLGTNGYINLFANYPIHFVGSFIGMFLIGHFIGLAIGYRSLPENQRTYKQLIFKFEPAKSL